MFCIFKEDIERVCISFIDVNFVEYVKFNIIIFYKFFDFFFIFWFLVFKLIIGKSKNAKIFFSIFEK